MLNFTTLKSRSARRTLTAIAWLLAGCLLTPTGAGAAEYYVAPHGSSSNDGSVSSPLDLATALSASSPARPGDTIWLRDGTYVGNFISDLVGSSSAPIIVRQYPGERAIIDANTSARTTSALTVRGSDTWYWGFEVTDSNPVRMVTGGYNPPRATSVWVLGSRTKFINMTVHDGEQGFGFWSSAVDSELYGNLIYNVGFESDDRGHGHSIYVQNTSGTKKITDNILFNGYSFGIHAYTTGGHTDHIHMVGNTIFNHGVPSRISGPKANLLMSGVDSQYPVIQDNVLYYSPFESSGRNLDLKPSCINGTISGNYSAGGIAASISCVFTTVTSNVFAGVFYTDISYPNNTYSTQRPSGARVFVRPNTYEPGARANITVFNWDRQSYVLVDLSAAGLPVGAEFEIRDAQNYFGNPAVSGVYTGESVLIPMTGLTVAPPVGHIPLTPVHTAPEFGAFILVRTSGAPPSSEPTASFSASPISIAAGQSATLSWSTGKATTVVINQGIGAVPASGSRTVAPSTTTTYTLTATNASGTVSRPVTIQVQTPPPVNPPPGGGTASASFVRLDTTTQGNWKGSYGVEGYKLSNDATTLPSYAQVTINENDWLWDGATADPRALQRSVDSSRFAGTWYAWSDMTVEVGLTDGKSHRVALYAVDWDGVGRGVQIEVLDATTGAVLDTRTGTDFSGGHYWVWDIAGRVRFRITNIGAGNVVLSGVFIDASDPGASNPIGDNGTATFVRTDETTRGTWKGVYGAEGYSLSMEGTSLPAYAQLSMAGHSSWTWHSSPTDQRALQRSASSGRIAATWYSDTAYSMDLTITDGQRHRIALYAIDWDAIGRTQTIELLDAVTNAVLDTRTVTAFSQGEYWTWDVSGHVRIRITTSAGRNAVISGVFFGAP